MEIRRRFGRSRRDALLSGAAAAGFAWKEAGKRRAHIGKTSRFWPPLATPANRAEAYGLFTTFQTMESSLVRFSRILKHESTEGTASLDF